MDKVGCSRDNLNFPATLRLPALQRELFARIARKLNQRTSNPIKLGKQLQQPTMILLQVVALKKLKKSSQISDFEEKN
jgi:hypothetical protein